MVCSKYEEITSMFTERLKYYRAISGLTASELARQVGVSPSVYSKFEAGKKRPNQQELDSIVGALKISVYDLFACGSSDSIKFEHGSFRKSSDLKKTSKEKIVAEIEDKLRNVVTLQGIIGKAAIINPPQCNVLSCTDNADDNARRLREHLGLAPSGPISNLVDIVENSGILLCECITEERAFSGLSGYVDKIPYIAYRGNMTAERIRSTIAHELVHLMFAWPEFSAKQEEHAANEISGCFLLTSIDAKREMGPSRKNIFNDGVLVCKEYGVSMMLLATRLKSLSILSDKDYKSFCIVAGKKGWRLEEPTRIQRERPSLFRQYVLRAIDEDLISIHRGAEFLKISCDDLAHEIIKS